MLQAALENAQKQKQQIFQKKSQSSRQGTPSGAGAIVQTEETNALRRRVNELERDLFNMTQGSGHFAPVALKMKVDELCLNVQRFLLAMKRLQRAVNSKDKDLQIYKVDFETSKKALEKLVRDTKENNEQVVTST